MKKHWWPLVMWALGYWSGMVTASYWTEEGRTRFHAWMEKWLTVSNMLTAIGALVVCVLLLAMCVGAYACWQEKRTGKETV